MRLIELELTNIKSYSHEVIKFADGINCILGLNGSGKSTIIESIGCVLFNYNQRTNNSLLRYNTDKGVISLIFEGNDNKIYQVIKTIRNKNNSNIKIIDIDNKQVLQENVSDVYEFIKKVMGITKEKSLSKMFEEIIAIPQGTFVNAFLDTPKHRKDNFDKLFELDIYNKLADEMKNLSDSLQKDYIYTLEKEIASLEGKLANFENVKEETHLIQEKNEEINTKLDSILKIYNSKVKEKENLEALKQKLETFNKQHKELEININNLQKQIKLNEENLDNAVNAAKLLRDNEFGYNLYLKTNKELKDNEMKYDKFLELSNQLKENESVITNLKDSNKLLSQMLHDYKVQLGLNKQMIIDKQKDVEQKQIANISLEKDLVSIREEIVLENQKITNTYAIYKFYLEKLNTVNEYLLSYNVKNDVFDIERKVLEIDEKLKDIKVISQQIVDLEKEKIKISNDLENLKLNSNYINDGCCPILKQKCLNIKESNLTDEVTKMINEKNDLLFNINIKINLLLQNNHNEEQLLKEKNLLLIEKINYEKDHDRFVSVLSDLNLTFKDDNVVFNEENVKSNVLELIKNYQNLKDNYKNDKYEELKKNELDYSNKVYSNHQQIQLIKTTIKELEKKNEELSLNIFNKEKEYNNNDFEISKKENDNSRINNSLVNYQDIKSKIDDNKLVLEKYQKNYETYISKQIEASNKEKYTLMLEEEKILLRGLEKNDKDIQYAIYDLEKQYSKENFDILIKEIQEMNNNISVYTTTININKERLSKLNEEIKNYENLYNEKERLLKKLTNYNELDNKYKIIRDVFKNISKDLSKQIRKYISIYASQLYRKISQENVMIDILDDYEVILIDCEDETKKKHLQQLSGGEQISVAISIRLAMLKQITNVEFYFMDEPTINLDYERRMMVSEVVKDMANELKQLFVISHDDTFELITDNSIKITKINNMSVLEEK